jgi:hypothetical protein
MALYNSMSSRIRGKTSCTTIFNYQAPQRFAGSGLTQKECIGGFGGAGAYQQLVQYWQKVQVNGSQ